MSGLWTGQELAEACGGRALGTLPGVVSGISIDSRSLSPGDAFFAITGERTDGHDFLTNAKGAGASVLVVAEARLPALGRISAPMIVVPDVLKAMEKAGAAARARFGGVSIAVTGSAGKTTTKEALRRALAPSGTVHASDKSFNNHWGVPLTLSRLPKDADFAVFEIGMNHAGEIRPLVKLARPQVAVVTLIAPAHLGHFSSLEEIAHAKAEIFEGVVPGGAALINRDDAHWGLLSEAARSAGVERVYGFGEHEGADYRLVHCRLGGGSSLATVSVAGKLIEVRIGAPGRHIVQNALAVLGVAHLAGADVAAAAQQLETLVPERGRGARHVLPTDKGELTLIDESYNANPASMRAALALLMATPVRKRGRRVAVLGDMRELGHHSAELHAGLAEAVLAAKVDRLFLVGPEMAVLAEAMGTQVPTRHKTTVAELEPLLLKELRGGDAVMVKSSNGIGSSRLVDAVVARFASQPPEAKRA